MGRGKLDCRAVMTPTEYRTARQGIGTQAAAARVLGVARSTVIRREDGSMPITTEASLAIIALAQHWPTVPLTARAKPKGRSK